MKKLSYLMYAFALTGVMFTISCDKDNDEDTPKTKRVSALVYKYDGTGSDDSIAFIYNSGGLLTKVEEYTVSSSLKTLNNSYEFQYVKNIPVSVITYEWTGTTKIADAKDSVAYDSKNRIEKYIGFDLINGKFVKQDDEITTVTYGTNNLPSKFSYSSVDYNEVEYIGNNISKTKDYEDNILKETTTFTYDSKKNPFKGNPFFMFEYVFINENNVLTETEGSFIDNFSYEYDSEGYPVKVIETYTSSGKKSGSVNIPVGGLKNRHNEMSAAEYLPEVVKIYYK